MTVFIFPMMGYLCACCHSQMAASGNCGNLTKPTTMRFYCPNERCVQFAAVVEIKPTEVEAL